MKKVGYICGGDRERNKRMDEFVSKLIRDAEEKGYIEQNSLSGKRVSPHHKQ